MRAKKIKNANGGEKKSADVPDGPKMEPWWFNQPLPIDRFTGWLVAWTFLLFIATTGLGIVAIFQWQVLRETDDTLKKTLSLTQRAWIDVAGISVEGEPKIGSGLKIRIYFSNIGETPALDMVAGHNPRIVDAPPADSGLTTLGGQNTTCDYLIPNQGWVVFPSEDVTYAEEFIPAAYITKEVISGEKSLALQGCIAYRTLEEVHFTWFCMLVFNRGEVATERSGRCGDGQGAN